LEKSNTEPDKQNVIEFQQMTKTSQNENQNKPKLENSENVENKGEQTSNIDVESQSNFSASST
jgi:hypothetical protein